MESSNSSVMVMPTKVFPREDATLVWSFHLNVGFNSFFGEYFPDCRYCCCLWWVFRSALMEISRTLSFSLDSNSRDEGGGNDNDDVDASLYQRFEPPRVAASFGTRMACLKWFSYLFNPEEKFKILSWSLIRLSSKIFWIHISSSLALLALVRGIS